MAKKIKFPLEMNNGVMVRTLEELRENFNLEKVVNYFISGKLITWLNDRYYESEAIQVGELNSSSLDFKKKICEIFDIEYIEENDIDIENIEKRNSKITKLKQFTENEDIIRNVDLVAFNQEELSDLLDENAKTIYLCDERFYLPLSKNDIKYIGISNPVLVINSKSDIDLDEKNIVIEDCILKSDNSIFLKTANSKGITYRGEIKKQNFEYLDWKVYIKEGIFYVDELNDEFEFNCEQDSKGKWYKNVNSLYRSRIDGSDEQLLVTDGTPVADFCVADDIIFFTTGYKSILSNLKVHRVNLDGSNRMDMNIECSSCDMRLKTIGDEYKSILCNKNYFLWIEEVKYSASLYKAKHDGTQKEKILSLDYLTFKSAKITDKYLFYIQGKNNTLYRVDLDTNSNVQIDTSINKLDTDGKNLYYLKWESTGWGEYKNDPQNCFYKTDLDGKNKVLLEHHYPFSAVVRMNYSKGILYYYTRKKMGCLSIDSNSPEIENKIILSEFK
ncbi:hypothetical protein [Clostridium sulfidigenes]|uniref:hypothetical protein n=1 Tax=Clostridium sulfidigenes TaxID=318464 RepID=UPI003F8A0A8E